MTSVRCFFLQLIFAIHFFTNESYQVRLLKEAPIEPEVKVEARSEWYFGLRRIVGKWQATKKKLTGWWFSYGFSEAVKSRRQQNCSTFDANWRSPFGAQKSWMIRKSDLRPSLWAHVRFGAFKKASPGDLRGCLVSHCLADRISNKRSVGFVVIIITIGRHILLLWIPCDHGHRNPGWFQTVSRTGSAVLSYLQVKSIHQVLSPHQHLTVHKSYINMNQSKSI